MSNTPFGVALTKEGMWTALEIPGMQAAIDLENRQQIMASATADHREAMRAFLEKRPPAFRERLTLQTSRIRRAVGWRRRDVAAERDRAWLTG